MYLRTSDLIFPRTICLNRLESRSIFRTTAPQPPPLRVLDQQFRPNLKFSKSSRKVSRRCVPGYWPNYELSSSRIARPAVAQSRDSLWLAERRASGGVRGPEGLTIRPQVRWKRTDWFPPARIRISAVVSIRKGRSWQQFFRDDPVPG